MIKKKVSLIAPVILLAVTLILAGCGASDSTGAPNPSKDYEPETTQINSIEFKSGDYITYHVEYTGASSGWVTPSIYESAINISRTASDDYTFTTTITSGGVPASPSGIDGSGHVQIANSGGNFFYYINSTPKFMFPIVVATYTMGAGGGGGGGNIKGHRIQVTNFERVGNFYCAKIINTNLDNAASPIDTIWVSKTGGIVREEMETPDKSWKGTMTTTAFNFQLKTWGI